MTNDALLREALERAQVVIHADQCHGKWHSTACEDIGTALAATPPASAEPSPFDVAYRQGYDAGYKNGVADTAPPASAFAAYPPDYARLDARDADATPPASAERDAVVEAWRAWSDRFTDPNYHSDTPIRDAFAAGWDARAAEARDARS